MLINREGVGKLLNLPDHDVLKYNREKRLDAGGKHFDFFKSQFQLTGNDCL